MRISPSKLQALRGCPCFEYKEGTNSAAEEGQMMHAAIATGNMAGMDDEQREQVTRVIALRDNIIAQEFAGADDLERVVEEKLVILDAETSGHRLQGSPDEIDISRKLAKAIIFDWKLGRLGLPTDAGDNLQLKAYAKAVCRRWPYVDVVDVVLVAPRTSEVSTATYTRGSMVDVEAEIVAVIKRVEDPFKEPDNSDQTLCAVCANLKRCPKQCRALVPAAQAVAAAPGVACLTKPVTALVPEEMADVLTLTKVVTEWFDQKKKAVTERVFDEELELPGYQKVTRKGNRKIQDVPAAVLALGDLITADRLWAVASLPIGAVVDINPAAEAVLEPFVSYGSASQFLQKSKKRKGS